MPTTGELLLTTKIRDIHLNGGLTGKQLPANSHIFFPRTGSALTNPFDWLLPIGEGVKIHPAVEKISHDQLLSLIQRASCPGGNFSVSIQDEVNWHVVPATLLCTPKAFLLLPEQGNAAQTFHKYFDDLQDLVHSCLFIELYQRYQPSYLTTFTSEQDLLIDYIEIIAQWICPSAYQLDEFSSIDFRDTQKKGVVQFDLTFTINEASTAKAFYQLPVHGYPVPEHTELKLELDEFAVVRRHLLQQQLEVFCGFIKNQWLQLRALSNPNAYALKILDEIIAVANSGKERLISPSISYDPIPIDPYEYAFFITDRGQWQIYFQKQNCSRHSSSPQGMHAILQMLKKPNKHFSFEDMHDHLKGMRTKYDVKGHQSTSDPGLDSILKEENEERFRTYLKQWEQMRSKDIKLCTKDDLFNLKHFRTIIEVKIEYSSSDSRLKLYSLIKKVTDKAERLSLDLDVDENFSRPLNNLKKDSMKTGNARNRLETIRKSIYRALEDFKDSAPALYQYLKETIVVVKTNTPDEQYLPFTYVPTLAKDGHLHHIDWITSP
jgi:hypothetical protein